MAWVLPVNLQSEDWIFLKALFALFPLGVREKPVLRLIVTKTPPIDLLSPDPMFPSSLAHSLTLFTSLHLTHCDTTAGRGHQTGKKKK